ncbi:hypothetical protein BDW67DRAFT_170661 [Aspergillus spinulosporus]
MTANNCLLATVLPHPSTAGHQDMITRDEATKVKSVLQMQYRLEIFLLRVLRASRRSLNGAAFTSALAARRMLASFWSPVLAAACSAVLDRNLWCNCF